MLTQNTAPDLEKCSIGWLSERLFIHLELTMCLRDLMEWNSYLQQRCLIRDAFWPRLSEVATGFGALCWREALKGPGFLSTVTRVCWKTVWLLRCLKADD